jgi:hypothetical protein
MAAVNSVLIKGRIPRIILGPGRPFEVISNDWPS